MLKLNTSNPNKIKEFAVFFADEGIHIDVSHQEVREIIANPIQVVAHKASQLGENVLVEDTSLDVAGEDVGVKVRWLLDRIATFIHKKAVWRVLLACQKKDGLVYVYEGITHGTIVPAQGKGFGFDPFFQPIGSKTTLAVAKPKHISARAKAVSAFVQHLPIARQKPIRNWQGAWQ